MRTPSRLREVLGNARRLVGIVDGRQLRVVDQDQVCHQTGCFPELDVDGAGNQYLNGKTAAVCVRMKRPIGDELPGSDRERGTAAEVMRRRIATRPGEREGQREDERRESERRRALECRTVRSQRGRSPL